MNWTQAIESNRTALRRIVAALFALAGLDAGTDGAAAAPPATLPRSLHRAVLGVLRPAEAALRRLIVIAAHDVRVTLGAAERARILERMRDRPPSPSGTGIFVAGHPARPGDLSRNPLRSAAQYGAGRTARTSPRVPAFPLFDPLKRSGAPRASASSADPRITLDFDRNGPSPVPPARATAPTDAVAAGHLCRRLRALGAALDDLPAQARRLARWRARRALTRGHRGRLSPLRPGPPPGHRPQGLHPVDAVLSRCHGLAIDAMIAPDTS